MKKKKPKKPKTLRQPKEPKANKALDAANETNDIYDEVPYGDEPFASTHPQMLASAATLFGLSPASPESCRVLELGCARGANLIGMAYALPESEFVGIELSEKQVRQGRAQIEKVGLKNIDLLHANILRVGKSIGEFDYIVSHGTLSWVPAHVRAKMFDICGELLKPQGVAYLSYNTYPGWKVRDIFRDMMLFEADGKTESAEKVKNARLALEIVARVLADNQSPYAQQIKEELPHFRNRPGWYFIHDFIAENNQPFYFADIMREAKRVGLQYLGDTEYSMMTFHGLTPQAQTVLHSLRGDVVRYEQYADIARNRSFRRTLLCREGLDVRRQVKPETLASLFFAARLRLLPEVNPERPNIRRFSHPNGGAIDIPENALFAALNRIVEAWPRALSGAELVTGLPPEGVRAVFEGILQGMFANLFEVRTSPGPMANTLPERPLASKLARVQALEAERVTSLLHEIVALEDFDREVIALLNGENSDQYLLERLFPEETIGEPQARRLAASLEKFVKEGLIHQA